MNLKLVVTLAVGSMGVLAFADDLAPPTWRNSDPSWTVQEWDFTNPAGFLAPDGNKWGSGGGGFVNPFGTPFATNTGASNGTSVWNAAFAGRIGVWRTANPNSQKFKLHFDVPGPGHGTHKSLVRIQVTSMETFGFGNVTAQAFATGSTATFLGHNQLILNNGWKHDTWDYDLSNCPTMTQVDVSYIGSGRAFDQVVIDTICAVPEPGTVAALTVGIVALVRRRRSHVVDRKQ